jgi:hypothetical protein
MIRRLAASRLPNSYKASSVLWRHSLHSICSRVAMFPPQLVRYFLVRYTRPGDAVADCWAGMGAVPLEACLTGRYGIGGDISPEAYSVMRAKLYPPLLTEVNEYLADLESRLHHWTNSAPDIDALGQVLQIPLYYHPKILTEILKLRVLIGDDATLESRRAVKARFVQALMLGILHGDRDESISITLDSSKALSPGHVKKMIHAFPNTYSPKYKRSVIDALRVKAMKVFADFVPRYRGRAKQCEADRFTVNRELRLVITSPPYMAVHTYAYDNRIRLWYLGHDYRDIKQKMNITEDKERYFAGVQNVLRRLQSFLAEDSAVVVVLGDIRKKERIVKLGEILAKKWVDSANSELKLRQVIVDRMRRGRKRYYDVGQRGIRTERILVFEKGRPQLTNERINWAERPFMNGVGV